MTTLAVYHKSVPSSKNQEKVDLLRLFAQGARTNGDTVIDVNDHVIQPCDVAVIQGWIAAGQPTTPHGDLRSRVIRSQRKQGCHVVGVDSNLFLYANAANPYHYLRYSFDGIFPSTGIYCDRNIDPARWESISCNLGITLRDYRKDGTHILLCMQRNQGWAMGDLDNQEWALDTIAKIRKHSDRPIVVRLHPGDKETKRVIKSGAPLCRIKFDYSVLLSHHDNLMDDLRNCWAVVNHNSSPVVGGAIEGYPIFVTDPENSQSKEIASTDFSTIENPALPDRQAWVERLSMFHWKFDELRSGACWNHMRQFI